MTQPTSDASSVKILLDRIQILRQLGPDSSAKLKSEASVLRFSIGQPLTVETMLPSHVYWILQGECRLLSIGEDSLSSLARMGPGYCVGLASLLRANPCENVTASTPVVALAVPDCLIVEFYKNESSFKTWCNQTLWAAELAEILHLSVKRNARAFSSPMSRLAKIVQTAQLITGSDQTHPKIVDKEFDGRIFFVASANTDQPIGTELDINLPLPRARPPFDLRVVSIPKDLIDLEDHLPSSSQPSSSSSELVGREAPALVQRGGLDLGQTDELSNFKLIPAQGQMEETLACLQMLALQLKLPLRRDSIEKILRDNMRRGQSLSLQLCGQLGASLGLHVLAAKVPPEKGVRLQPLSMVPWKESFALVISSDVTGLKLASPSNGIVKLIPDQLEEAFPEGIEVLIMERAANTPEKRFGPDWFIPVLSRYKGVLIQVLIASFVVQLFSLANPLLIQVIIDKVISQRSLDTLQILGIGLVIVTLLEGILSSLRTFLFTETTNRIDQRLAAEVIDHLLRLPLNYFDRRPVGELGTRIAELEKIRNFLTGTALTTVLDAAFSVIYIIVMAFYSWLLTFVALAVLPLQIGITLLGAPLFRRQFRQAAEENAKTQSHLVEVLTGIQTVKAQNVEMVSRWKWQDLYSSYITKTFEQTITGTALTQTSQVFQKLSQLLVLWVGAALVLQGDLSLGQLIAFRIISGYVTQPLLRLSSIWQNIQELKVSFERLADVIDTPTESSEGDQAKIPLPPIKGDVKIEDLSFSFKQDQGLVLKNINLNFIAGSFIGIVGQSGSGKSTLMKLLPRLYSPQKGCIKIDGYDIDKVELYSLRRQIGIVPQDPLLFSGTVAENISLTNPNADNEDIVNSAKLACAHDFIMELPMGYSTPVGERGGSLSGGQRQRIAIARTLLSKPKFLVMDEATSALDYETERKLCDNLIDNLADCTVFFVTHRLTTIKRASHLILLHKGVVVEEGTHDSLMSMAGRYYALYRQQDN